MHPSILHRKSLQYLQQLQRRPQRQRFRGRPLPMVTGDVFVGCKALNVVCALKQVPGRLSLRSNARISPTNLSVIKLKRLLPQTMPDQLLNKKVECPVCGKLLTMKSLLYTHQCDKQPGRPTQNPTNREYRLFHRACSALVARMADAETPSAAEPQLSGDTGSQ